MYNLIRLTNSRYKLTFTYHSIPRIVKMHAQDMRAVIRGTSRVRHLYPLGLVPVFVS